MTNKFKSRFKQALRAEDARAALFDLARAFKNEGMPPRQIHSLYQEKLAEHINDHDDSVYDLLHEVMDAIADRADP